jgi:hypothetical protein
VLLATQPSILEEQVRERRGDHPGRDRVDPNRRGVLQGGRRGERGNRRLRSRVRRLARGRTRARDRRRRHDRTGTRLEDERRDRLEPVEHAGEVQRHDPLPLGEVPVVDLRHRAAARVVEQQRQSAQLLVRVTRRGVQGVEVGDIDRVREAVDVACHLAGALLVDVDDGDSSAFGGHAPAGRGADSRRAAGHERSVTVEQTHAATVSGHIGARSRTR